MYTSEKLVRFDWAIKRLLRNRGDYCIVEGLLTALLGKKMLVKSLMLTEAQKDAFHCDTPSDIFPAYYLLRADPNIIARVTGLSANEINALLKIGSRKNCNL